VVKKLLFSMRQAVYNDNKKVLHHQEVACPSQWPNRPQLHNASGSQHAPKQLAGPSIAATNT